ncbi:MAG: peptidoglycan DD-metalloendopeptidase family protein [Candidatus Cryptobacteroides sp.]|nr:peptidoglycan DD-metalloendopeptidase family protein [Candidatus Cryptobacteroides sp.]
MMKGAGRKVAALSLALLLSLPGLGQNTRQQEAKKARLQEEIALIDKQLKDNAAKSSNVMNTLSLLSRKIESRKKLVEESDREISALNGQINVRQKEIDRLQNRIDTLTLYYEKLISTAYRNRDSKIWYMYILASENLGQAFRRMAYMKNLSSDLNRQGEKIKDARAELIRETDSLTVLRSKAQELRNKRAFEISTLKAEQAQSEKLAGQLKRNRTKYQKELAYKKRQVDALNKEIERIIAAAVGGSRSGSSGKDKTVVDTKLNAEFAGNKGRLPWPASGPVVDKFGQHYHPVFKSVKLPFNNGINIALSPGTPVKAVFNGTVKQIVVMPGYNKCVLVQHGNYFSFYCKLDSVSVKAGDKISTGDIIGTVGTIDNMTQLHFQIWQGTRPQNPELWLKAY